MKEEKIFDIIIRSLQSEASVPELKALEVWKSEKVANNKLVDDISKIWNDTRLVVVDTDKYNVDAAWEKINKRIIEFEQQATIVRPLYPATKTRWLVAASIAALVVLSVSVYFFNKGKELITASTLQGQMQEILLADGTKVILNKNSSFTYPGKFSGDTREVNLQGEAFFEVAKNAEKPFIIQTPTSSVRVVGTSFNVRAYDAEQSVEVNVVTGKVAFGDKSGKNKVLLLPGNKGSMSKRDSKIAVDKTYESNFSAWQTKKISFSGTKLDRVLGTLENYFEVEFKVSDQKIYNCSFTGNFEQPNINEVLDVLSASMGITWTKSGTIYTLQGEGCEK
jgi:transmembrane sensor